MLTALDSLTTLAFIPMPGPMEWVIILAVVLIIFGPKKLPEMGKAIGQSIKELKKATEAKEEQPEEAKKD